MAKTGKRPTTVKDSDAPVFSEGPAPLDVPSEKKDRRSFPATEDGGVKWDGFKSDKHRAAMRTLIEREAEALGMKKAADGAVAIDDKQLTAAQLFTLINVVSQPLALRFTGCTPEQAATLNITDADLKILNENGITDKMIAKYLPSVQIGLELTWSLALLSVAATKWTDFNKARLQAKMDAEQAKTPRDNVVAHPSGLIRAESLAADAAIGAMA